MEMFIMAILRIIIEMDSERFFSKMEKNIEENGKTENQMVIMMYIILIKEDGLKRKEKKKMMI